MLGSWKQLRRVGGQAGSGWIRVSARCLSLLGRAGGFGWPGASPLGCKQGRLSAAALPRPTGPHGAEARPNDKSPRCLPLCCPSATPNRQSVVGHNVAYPATGWTLPARNPTNCPSRPLSDNHSLGRNNLRVTPAQPPAFSRLLHRQWKCARGCPGRGGRRFWVRQLLVPSIPPLA